MRLGHRGIALMSQPQEISDGYLENSIRYDNHIFYLEDYSICLFRQPLI